MHQFQKSHKKAVDRQQTWAKSAHALNAALQHIRQMQDRLMGMENEDIDPLLQAQINDIQRYWKDLQVLPIVPQQVTVPSDPVDDLEHFGDTISMLTHTIESSLPKLRDDGQSQKAVMIAQQQADAIDRLQCQVDEAIAQYQRMLQDENL